MSESRPRLIDTHCHLMDEQYRTDLDEVLERAWKAGLWALVCVGYDLESSLRAVELAHQHRRIFATVGIHPNYAAQAGPEDMARIAELAAAPKVVGIGETGLDCYRDYSPIDLQESLLRAHFELAEQRRLPLVIHNRDASERLKGSLLEWVRAPRGGRGVLHCFSGDGEMLRSFQEGGWFVSFAGPVTFKNAGQLPTFARDVDAARMVVETDAPYLAPVPMRGRRNEPAFLIHTVRRLADLREEPPSVTAEATYRNALALFPGLEMAGE